METTADEVDRPSAAPGEGGEAMMPLGRHPFSWLGDRFGVSRQRSAG